MPRILEHCYARLPVPLQNAAISAYGYYWKRERLGVEYERTVVEFGERDNWPIDRMRDHLNSALPEVLRQAFEAPFYRDNWAAAGIRESHLRDTGIDTLSRLPVLDKEHLRRDPTAFVPSRTLYKARPRSYYSSGSTGTPIRAICTRESHQRFVAAREIRSFNWAGVGLAMPRAMVGGRLVVPKAQARAPFYRFNLAEKQVYFSAYHIAPENIVSYVEGLNRYQPAFVTGYAFSQFAIARMMLKEELALNYKPLAAITSSEKLTPPMRDTIRRAWGCRAYEEYGSVENCGLATECEHGRLHVSPDFGIIEIVDDEGNPVAAGVEGRVLCTGLLNSAQFLVRYDIGDRAVWSEEECPCGRRHLPVLERIVGRVEDVVVGRDGREMVRFHGIFIDLPHVMQGQVIQEGSDRFRVCVIVEHGFGDRQVREIHRRFEQRLGPTEVVVQQVDDLERTPSGKVRAVINRMDNSTVQA